MTLANPLALLGLLFPAGIALFCLLRKSRPRLPSFVGERHACLEITGRSRRRLRAVFALTLFGLSCLVLAAAQPVKESASIEEWAEGIDLAIVVDISESMEATDFLPTRMEVAKSVLKDFVRKRAYDRIGLVLFGGEAVTKSPLTRDYDFLIHQIDDIRFRELKQGTAIGMGLLGGVTRLRKAGSKNKVIVLVTDGDSNVGTVNPLTSANLAHQEGIKVYTIGIGQNDRVVVPIYSYDAMGRRGQLIAQVPSYLNPDLLKRISFTTGGKSYMARDGKALTRFINEIDALEKTKILVRKKKQILPLFRRPLLVGTLLLLLSCFFLETRFRESYAH